MSIFEKEALLHSKMKSSKWISNSAAEVQSTSIFPYGTLYEFAGVNFCLQTNFWQKFRQIDGIS